MKLERIDDKFAIFCKYEDRDIVKTIKDYQWNSKKKCWMFPFRYDKFLMIKKVFPDIEFDKSLENNLILDLEVERQARIIKSKKIITLDDTYPFPAKFPPKDHQTVGLKFLTYWDKCCLWDEQGTGKTYQAIVTALYRKQNNGVTQCFIICPNTIKSSVWEKQINKFCNEKVLVVEGSKNKRIKLINDENAFFKVVNYEAVDSLLMFIRPMTIKEMVILDEAHRMKNVDAKVTKAIYKLHPEYIVSMTGTPVANNPQDLYSVFDYVQPNILGINIWAFINHYLNTELVPINKTESVKKVIGYKKKCIRELKNKLSPFYIRRLKKDVLDLPPKVYETQVVELNTEERKHYEEIKEQCVTYIEGLDDQELKVSAYQVITQMLRLSQICDGYLSAAQDMEPIWLKGESKLKALDQVLESYLGKNGKAVIWTRFVPVVKKLYDRYKDKYKTVRVYGEIKSGDRAKNIEYFQEGEAEIFIAQIQTCSVGLDLYASALEIFMEKAFLSYSDIVQAEDRCHRQGTTKTVSIISLVCKDTIDERWEAMLKRKTAQGTSIFDTEVESVVNRNILKELV